MSRELAKLWEQYNGSVKVWMLPYKKFGFSEAFEKLMAEDNSVNAQYFAMLDWCFADAEIASHAPSIWRAFKAYFPKRTPHDLIKNWQLFQELGSVDLLNDWNIAYDQTREVLLSSTYYKDDEDATDTDPKDPPV